MLELKASFLYTKETKTLFRFIKACTEVILTSQENLNNARSFYTIKRKNSYLYLAMNFTL